LKKKLDEVPQDYLDWLEKQDWISRCPGLKEALESFKQKKSLKSLKKTPEGPFVLNFGIHQGKCLDEVPSSYITFLNTADISSNRPDLAAALKAFNDQKKKTPYVLDFSSHIGKSLEQCPPTFIDYLNSNPEITEKRPDLQAALKTFNRNNRHSQIQEAKNSSWVPPSDRTSDARRYHKNGRQMWIAASDTLRFFGAEPEALLAAGLHHCRKNAFWVHQVFSFAKHHGTTHPDTATKALNKFKAKNYSK